MNATLENVDKVGNVRRQELRSAGVVNVGDLAEAEATELFAQTSGISASDIEKIIDNARHMVGIEQKASVEIDDDTGTPMKYVPDDEDEADEDDEPSVSAETMDADAFLDAGADASPDPDECENVALIAGDDAFDHNGPHGDKTPQEQAGLVQRRLMEFGFDPEAIGAVGSGMGREAVNSWVSYTMNETDRELPELHHFEVDPSGEYPTRGDYQARNKQLLDWADAVCVVANGDYVGMWVNMANEHDVLIRTPDQD